MEQILVSTIITTYKRDVNYLKEAIDSVLSQTYNSIEIIIVDDNGVGSEYEQPLRELCEKYKNVVYLPNEKNSGAQISRNNGIRASKGEFVAFLDDDDFWECTKIEKQLALFSDDKIGMVFCDGYSFVDNDKSKLGEFREASIFNHPITHNMELFNDWIGSTSQAIIRRSVLNDVGYFDEDMPARQDYEMWLRITRKYLIVGSSEKLLYYRIHSGERISTNWQKCLRSYQLILEKYKVDYNNYKYAKAKLILYMAKCCNKTHNYLGLLKYIIFSFITSPKCLVDIIIRKIQKKGFAEYYDKIIKC